MNETRPPVLYFFLLASALGVWSLQAPARWLGALGVLVSVAFAYRTPLLLRPKPLTFFIGALFSFLFAYFVIYADSAETFVLIYSQRQFQALGLCLLAMIVLQWYSWSSRRFDWLFFSIGLFLLFSTVFTGLASYKLAYIWLVLSFITAFVLSRLPLSAHWSARPSLLNQHKYVFHVFLSFGIFILLSTNIIALAEWVDDSFSENFSEFVMRQQSGWSGFSGTTHLQGNANVQLSERIALLINSPRPLEYLRGNVLTAYHKGLWSPQDYITVPLLLNGPVPQTKAPQFKKEFLIIPGSDHRPSETGFWAQIQLKNHHNGLLFLPAQASLAAIPSHAPVYQNQYGLLRQERQSLELDYWIWVEQGFSPVLPEGAELRKENLGVPFDVRLALRPLALEITKGALSPLEKAARLEQWFKQNFRYSLQTQAVPPDVDPTVDFVLNRKPAYCSWFASGMVLMLRSLDIPAHLVSGWRGMEHVPLSQTWVVREKQAHDWVEVFEPLSGTWVPFDPTPGQQLDALLEKADIFNALQRQFDGLRLFFSLLKARLSVSVGLQWQDLLSNLQAGALALLSQPVFYLVLVLLGGLNAFLKRLRAKPIQAKPTPGELNYLPLEPQLAQLNSQFEQELSRRGISTAQTQTLGEIGLQIATEHPELYETFEQIQVLFNQLRFASLAPVHYLPLLVELQTLLVAWQKTELPVQAAPEPGVQSET